VSTFLEELAELLVVVLGVGSDEELQFFLQELHDVGSGLPE